MDPPRWPCIDLTPLISTDPDQDPELFDECKFSFLARSRSFILNTCLNFKSCDPQENRRRLFWPCLQSTQIRCVSIFCLSPSHTLTLLVFKTVKKSER